MSDIFERVTGEQNIFQKILGKIPGFSGYLDRQNRRAADKLLRETVANRYEEQYQRISGIQRDLIGSGDIAYVGDMESASIKLRQFIDRIRTASYGYAGLFDAVKVESAELEQIYQYDLMLVEGAEEVGRAIDNVESSMGTDGLKAAIRHLVSLAQKSVDAFNKRSEVILGTQK